VASDTRSRSDGKILPAVLINAKQIQKMLDDFHESDPQVVFFIDYPAMYNANPEYFDATWKSMYRDPEFSIYLGPKFRSPDGEPEKDGNAAVMRNGEFVKALAE
jgi:hypothetical protein